MTTDLIGCVVQFKGNVNASGTVRAVAASSCSSRWTLLVQCDGDQLVAVDHTEVIVLELAS